MRELVYGKFKLEAAADGVECCLIKAAIEDGASGIGGMLNITVVGRQGVSCRVSRISHDIELLDPERSFSVIGEEFEAKLQRELMWLVERALDYCGCEGWDGVLPEPEYQRVDVTVG
jgi:hypothetical protein